LEKSEDSCILALDEGTTSARAVLFDQKSKILGLSQFEFSQIYPKPGWVEHNPEEIWEAQVKAFRQVLNEAKVELGEVAAIGIANQRETTILWDRSTGRPVYNAIVWQCRRTADLVEELRAEYESLFKEKTGLVPDSYFSGPKIKWLLENVTGLQEKAFNREILFGTVDSFLIWRLTGGRVHVIDYTNASRTMLFNIHELKWDDELLEALDVPESILPDPRSSSEIYGYTEPKVIGASIPIAGDLGDQQAALFGQTAFEKGAAKCTYGTGNFLLMNTGEEPCPSKDLLTTVAWSSPGKLTYALEGSIFITGAAVQWLRDSLRIIDSSPETEALASSLSSNEGVYFVPAFVGLGAPYWDQYARGAIIGLTRGVNRAHLARATLEAIAYLTRDVVEVMEKDSGVEVNGLRVDGGASRNDFLMQFQADILGKKIVRPAIHETTALGAAYAAGLAVDYWNSLEELSSMSKINRVFEPGMDEGERERLYKVWKAAVEKTLGWGRLLRDAGLEQRR